MQNETSFSFSKVEKEFTADWLNAPPAQCNVLRGHQRDLLAQIAAALHRGQHRILAQGPTGSGKTHVIASIALCAWLAGLRVLVLATRTRIVNQLHERLSAFDVAHGVLAAPLPDLIDLQQRVQVASVDTLYRRALVDHRMPLPAADVVIFDEAHLALGASRTALLESYPNAALIGFTATPAKTSGRALGEQFDHLILGPSVSDLIDARLLVRPRIFNVPAVTGDELRALPKDGKTNDYITAAVGELMRKPKLVGDVVSNWLRITNGKRTLVFACNKAHGADLVADFLRQGVAAELLTDQNDEDSREAAIARLESGSTQVLVNCLLLSYGIDIPAVECVVLARPTRSVVLYLQAIGRGMRPADGKESVIVIDHGRVIESLGLPTEDFRWSLRQGVNVNRSAWESHGEGRKQSAEKARTCRECSHMWLVSEEGPGCRECGWMPMPKAKPIAVQEAELLELDARREQALWRDIEGFHSEACGFYARTWPDRWSAAPSKGRFWAWSKTRERFGLSDGTEIPKRFWRSEPRTPSMDTNGWLKSQQIRWAKRRAA